MRNGHDLAIPCHSMSPHVQLFLESDVSHVSLGLQTNSGVEHPDETHGPETGQKRAGEEVEGEDGEGETPPRQVLG